MKRNSMKHRKPSDKKWFLATAILLGWCTLASAVPPDMNRDVYGSWVMVDQESAGMDFYPTLTIHPDRIDILHRCSYGDKWVEASTSVAAQITENEITITEAKSTENEYSPGFLKCRAAIAPMSINYRLSDGKLILFVPGKDESHELLRASVD